MLSFGTLVTFLQGTFNVLWIFYVNICFPVALLTTTTLLIVSALDFDTGILRFYIDLMLKLFEFCSRTIERKKRRQRLNSLRLRSKSEDDDQSSTDEEAAKLDRALARARQAEEYEKRLREEKPFFMQDGDEQHEFSLCEIYQFATQGIRSIADDEVTKRFSAEELPTWNLLSRTYKSVKIRSIKLNLLWISGFIIRFLVLFPIRFVIFISGMQFLIAAMAILGYIPNSPLKRSLYYKLSICAYRLLAGSLSAVITYHNKQHKAVNGSVCVANHTSPIDVLMLHCDNAYALVGQAHGGFLGFLQKTLSKATSHVFCERSESEDRLGVSTKLREHVEDKDKLPVLIFPEGTCINNSAVMMFKKGSFEAADVVYPVAIKYNPIFGDAFWNSSRYGYFTYLMMMMTSWAIVCQVWYLKPMHRQSNESSIDFASRVKAAIARQGGLVDLEWDGALKRSRVKPNLIQKVQNIYSRKISVPLRPVELQELVDQQNKENQTNDSMMESNCLKSESVNSTLLIDSEKVTS